jgi:hypothetical protein
MGLSGEYYLIPHTWEDQAGAQEDRWTGKPGLASPAKPWPGGGEVVGRTWLREDRLGPLCCAFLPLQVAQGSSRAVSHWLG